MTVDAVHRAERLQAMALANIHAQYQTEKPKDLYAMTLDEFIAEMEEAQANGTEDEFNVRIRAYIEPLIQQIQQPQQGATNG